MVLQACRETAPEVVTETVIEIVTETVIETIEVTPESPFTYEALREMAKAGVYEGDPAADHTMAFANINKSLPFCTSVENNIIEEWQLAGGPMNGLLILDNDADPETALKNAQIVFDSGIEVLLEYQLDIIANARIAEKAAEAGTFIIGIDVQVPGFPFMGIDNYGLSTIAAEWAVRQAGSVYGGLDNVDRVLVLWDPDTGDQSALRMTGAMEVLEKEFGPDAYDEVSSSKITVIDSGITADSAESALKAYLYDNPDDRAIMIFCPNSGVSEGVYSAAMAAERWDPEEWMVISYGLDDAGSEFLQSGIIDAVGTFSPEDYGKYLIPGALAHMYGNPVPPYMFMENEVITAESIDDHQY
ncbi:MAG: sugar ABC transporter substrate-binding protein [Actinomycetia bacterium]|nr:sugar ABC transporter substrate-binding protein [Actinomycetes bacterium]